MLLRQSMASSTSKLRPWSQGPFVFTMVLQGLVNLPSEWLDWWMTGMHYGYTRAYSGSPKEERKERKIQMRTKRRQRIQEGWSAARQCVLRTRLHYWVWTLTLFPLVPGQMSGTAYWLLLHSVTGVPNRKKLIREDLFGFMVSEMEQRNLRPGSFTDSLGALQGSQIGNKINHHWSFCQPASKHDFL